MKAVQEALFWVLLAGSAFPYPVVQESDQNVYVRVPGKDSTRILPKSREGKTWTRVPEAGE